MYMVHPNAAAPPGVRKPESATIPPKVNIQNPNALSLGNATSGAPICSGIT